MNNTSPPTDTHSLMLVEDTPSLQMLYRTVLRKAGYPAICATTGAEALAQFEEHRPQVVLLDLMLPDRDGLSVMSDILRLEPDTRIVVITADGAISKAVEATRRGAHDYLVKPLGDRRLVSAVATALNGARQASQVQTRLPADPLTLGVFDGNSAAIERVRAQVAALAGSMANVVIQGEGGTGRCACAEQLHSNSPRARRPMVTVSCSGASSERLWKDLFGLDQTGPQARSALARAQGGSLVLYEPQDMPQDIQTAMLKVLSEGLLPPGPDGEQEVVDFRLISVTGHDLRSAPREDGFNAELSYRLAVLSIDMPPLRKRADDIPLLARTYMGHLARQEGKDFTQIAPDALAALTERDWPGNLRELTNVLRQAVVLHDGPELRAEMLPSALPGSAPEPVQEEPVDDPLDAFAGLTLAQMERQVIEAVIERHGGSVPQAARELDIAPSTIYRKRDAWEASER